MKFVLSLLFLASTAYGGLVSDWGIHSFPTTLSFEQTRYIALTKISLKSSGEVTLKEDNSILWNQTKPFLTSYQIRDGEVITTVEGKVQASKSNALFAKIISMFHAILNGNEKAINDYFKLTTQSKDRLELAPRDEVLAKGLEKILLTKSKDLRTLEVFEKSGNKLTINFHNQ